MLPPFITVTVRPHYHHHHHISPVFNTTYGVGCVAEWQVWLYWQPRVTPLTKAA